MTLSAVQAPARGRGKPHTYTLRVHALAYEADGVVSVTFTDPEGAALPAWEAGAHVDVHLSRGLVRQYSLCGSHTDPQSWTVGVRLDERGRGGSRFVHEELRVGSLVQVTGPRQNFGLVPAEAYVFVAGGIGITPMLPMVESARIAGIPFTLHYAGRSRARMPFLERIRQCGAPVTLYCSDEGDRLDLGDVLGSLSPRTVVYCCGPQGMLLQAASLLDGTQLVTEQFAPTVIDLYPAEEPAMPGAGKAAEQERGAGPENGHAFEVQLGNNGAVIPVGAGQSVLDALDAAGVDVPWSCREGTCATCETGVLEGSLEHRDNILSDDEKAAGDVFFPCVSRACSGCPRLVLDL